MSNVKQWAYEPETCRVCGAELTHEPTGRPKRFCSGRCRVRHHRDVKRWARACVDAVLAGKPEPSHPYPLPPPSWEV